MDKPKNKRKISINDIIAGIILIAQDGVAWRRLRPSKGKYQIYYYYFHKWTKLGIFKSAEDILRRQYVTGTLDRGLYFKELYSDTSLIVNRLGSEGMGPNPCNRGRPGNKIAVLSDYFNAPLSIVIFPANNADQNTIEPLFRNLGDIELTRDKRIKLVTVTDMGYTATEDLLAAIAPYGATLLAPYRKPPTKKPKIPEPSSGQLATRNKPRKKKIPKKKKKLPRGSKARFNRRWKIEHFNARFKQFRRLDKRYDRQSKHFNAFFHIVCGILLLESTRKSIQFSTANPKTRDTVGWKSSHPSTIALLDTVTNQN